MSAFIGNLGPWELILLLMLIPFIIISAALYLLPSIIAFYKNRTNKRFVIILNIFLGWTIIAWIILLVLTLKNENAEANI